MTLHRLSKPTEEKKDKPAKQPREVDAAAAAGLLDHASLAQ